MARKQVTEEGKTKRRRRRMQTWQKTVCLIAVLFLGFVAYRVGAKVLRPVILCFGLHSEVRQLDNRAKAADAETIALEKRKQDLLSREGAETEARKLGYVHKGETPIIMDKSKEPEKK